MTPRYAATATTGVGLRPWADDNGEASIGGHHHSYLDAVVSTPSASATARPCLGLGPSWSEPLKAATRSLAKQARSAASAAGVWPTRAA